jgi:hypothetical protein
MGTQCLRPCRAVANQWQRAMSTASWNARMAIASRSSGHVKSGRSSHLICDGIPCVDGKPKGCLEATEDALAHRSQTPLHHHPHRHDAQVRLPVARQPRTRRRTRVRLGPGQVQRPLVHVIFADADTEPDGHAHGAEPLVPGRE